MSLPRLNAHLWRQLVGRGLYVSNLDWWYASHQSEDILLVCSEDLNDADKAASEMGRVAAFIGLSPFDLGRPCPGASTTPARSTKAIMQ